MKLAKHAGLTWDKIALLVIIVVAFLSVVSAFSAQALLNPERQAEKTLETMAREYYEVYYYPKLVGTQNDLSAIEKYAGAGVPTVYLRQLLHYSGSKFEEKAEVFNQKTYFCDTNTTGVRFFPKAPFGVKDYEIEYYWHCEKPLSF